MINQTTKELILEGLDCANCASKIETAVSGLAGIKLATVDFRAKRLILEGTTQLDLEKALPQVVQTVKRYEPDVKVVAEDQEKIAGKSISKTNRIRLARILIGALLFFIAAFFNLPDWMDVATYFVSYLVVGGGVLVRAARNILRGQVFDENFLMSIATLGALAIKEFPEGVAVMLFYQIGEFFQGLAVNKSRKSIESLLDLRPDFANLKLGNELTRVSPEQVATGDVIVVKPGEKIPMDGIILEGHSLVDTSALTGEPKPRVVHAGSEVFGGFVNKDGLLTVEVTKVYGESTVAKILSLVQNASSRKAPTESFITKFAGYYTPVVVLIALGLATIPPLLISGAMFSQWIYRALVFLVISCPCALVVSIPLGFFGGIGGASRSGILVKGGNYLEALNKVEYVVFDKTGTLTKGIFKVSEVTPAGDLTKESLLEHAAIAESYSNHPIAVSILRAYANPVNKQEIEKYVEISGYGVQAMVRGKEVLAGNYKLMDSRNISYEQVTSTGTVVHIAIDSRYTGFIVISDEIKPDSSFAIKRLKELGVKKTVMLTGDSKTVGAKVGEQLGLDEIHAELLPDQKVEMLELLEAQKSPKGKVAFVGDGINDAPVLARADIGIAMGGLGSDAAIEAADIVIMTDEPAKIASAIMIAKRTRNIVWQNIFFALGVKSIVLILGAVGIATMWEAVFADVGVTLIAVLNAIRVMHHKINPRIDSPRPVELPARI